MSRYKTANSANSASHGCCLVDAEKQPSLTLGLVVDFDSLQHGASPKCHCNRAVLGMPTSPLQPVFTRVASTCTGLGHCCDPPTEGRVGTINVQACLPSICFACTRSMCWGLQYHSPVSQQHTVFWDELLHWTLVRQFGTCLCLCLDHEVLYSCP